MSLLRYFLVLALVLYVFICAAVYFFQRSLQYFPVAASMNDAEKVGLFPLMSTADGSGRLLGHVTGNVGNPERVVVVFHGNGGNALGRVWLLELFRKSGIEHTTATVFAEYPGYGVRVDAGEPTESAILGDAMATFDVVKVRWPAAKIIVIGESLGTGVAVAVAAERAPDMLALISPFSSASDVAAKTYPFLPVRWLMHDTFDSMRRIANVNMPLFVVHGSADTVVPLEFGRRLFDAYPGSVKNMKILSGVDHNDMAMALIEGQDEGELGRAVADFQPGR